ncbi:unnamed protein product [Effrenium voratum]|uniref:Uncharacterized protein n=1 Tax=Effrenium voratum TaxID=2562239 RepID=A0AA36NDK0_9DINO|nr:unnamed protein product [Effrenium voratum]
MKPCCLETQRMTTLGSCNVGQRIGGATAFRLGHCPKTASEAARLIDEGLTMDSVSLAQGGASWPLLSLAAIPVALWALARSSRMCPRRATRSEDPLLQEEAAVPGYGGFIPSKVAGNCFGKRMALDNLHATEMRKLNDEGAESRTNWIVACETNRKRLAHGAFAVKENFQFTREAPNRDRDSAWQLWEPKTAHQWMRY